MRDSNFTTIFGDSDVVGYLEIWSMFQTTLVTVFRWNDLPLECKKRDQTTLQHTVGIMYMGDSIVTKLNRETTLDLKEILIMRALMFHDFPEGLRQKDVAANKKTPMDDLNEYMAFCFSMVGMSRASFKVKEYAYLLQFAHNIPDIFPERAKNIMLHQIKHHRAEVYVFAFLEKYDYVMFALEVFRNTDDNSLLAYVLSQTSGFINDMVKEVPELSLIWSPGFKARCQKVLELK